MLSGIYIANIRTCLFEVGCLASATLIISTKNVFGWGNRLWLIDFASYLGLQLIV